MYNAIINVCICIEQSYSNVFAIVFQIVKLYTAIPPFDVIVEFNEYFYCHHFHSVAFPAQLPHTKCGIYIVWLVFIEL